MNVLDHASMPGKPGEPSYFTGEVTLKALASSPGDNPTKLLRVEFSPGARTHWHTHTNTQLLVVVEGRCRFQHEGGPVQEAGPGEAIHIPPGEKHWHGASADARMVHLAVNVGLETDWLEPVSDEQFSGMEA